MKKSAYILITITLLFLSCLSSNKKEMINSIKEIQELQKNNDQFDKFQNKKNINGIYTFSDSSIKSIVTVSENNWFGKLIIKSNFGSSYDNSNASYSSGKVKNGILYDDSGIVECGSVNGASLSIPIGDSRVIHYK